MNDWDNTNKILLLADDSELGRNLVLSAEKYNFRLDFRHSLMDLGSFAALGQYQLILVDHYLESMRGDEVAQYVEAFFQHIPVIIVAADPIPLQVIQFPKCVRSILNKNAEPANILAECRLQLAGVPGSSVFTPRSKMEIEHLS
jgi:DNA-binding response OmpR family regulator